MSESENEIGDLGPSEYLFYRVLVDRDNQNDRETSRTRIHKLCCLSDRRLKETYGHDIGFPKHWDKYGRVAEEHSINRDIIFGPNANTFGGQAYYPADQVSETDFDHIDSELKEDIFRAVRETIKKHGEKTSEELQEIQYSNYSPNKFIQLYGDLRWHLAALSLEQDKPQQSTVSAFHSEPKRSEVERLLDEMLINFPEEEYSEIYNLYLTWDDTMRLLEENDARPREKLDFLENFIQKLSKIVLRFEHRSDIPDYRIERWREDKPRHKQELEDQINRVRERALNGREISGVLESVSESYNKSVIDSINDI